MKSFSCLWPICMIWLLTLTSFGSIECFQEFLKRLLSHRENFVHGRNRILRLPQLTHLRLSFVRTLLTLKFLKQLGNQTSNTDKSCSSDSMFDIRKLENVTESYWFSKSRLDCWTIQTSPPSARLLIMSISFSAKKEQTHWQKWFISWWLVWTLRYQRFSVYTTFQRRLIVRRAI
jgi:hypothetical protein